MFCRFAVWTEEGETRRRRNCGDKLKGRSKLHVLSSTQQNHRAGQASQSRPPQVLACARKHPGARKSRRTEVWHQKKKMDGGQTAASLRTTRVRVRCCGALSGGEFSASRANRCQAAAEGARGFTECTVRASRTRTRRWAHSRRMQFQRAVELRGYGEGNFTHSTEDEMKWVTRNETPR